VKDEHVKIDFDLSDIQEGNWPPTDFEGIWAVPLDDGNFRIDNIPFYVRSLSDHDIVAAHLTEHDKLVFDRVIARGGHSTYRIFLTDRAHHDKALLESWWMKLEELGCGYESVNDRYYAIDMPPKVEVSNVYRLLEEGEREGVWHFEEGFYAGDRR